MADDIVTHLRRWGDTVGSRGMMRALHYQAADEITRLRAEVASLTQQCDDYSDEIGNCRVLEWRELSDQLAEALRCTYGLDMTHLDRVKAHNMAVRALAAYEAAHKEKDNHAQD